MRDLLPRAMRFALLVNPGTRTNSAEMVAGTKDAATAIGLQVHTLEFHNFLAQHLCPSPSRRVLPCPRRGCRYYYLDDIERRVIDGLRDKLGTREAVTYFVDLYNAKRRKASATAKTQSADLERKLAAAERELKRAIDGMIRGTISEAEADQVIPELRRRRDRLSAQIESAAKPPKVVAGGLSVDRFGATMRAKDVRFCPSCSFRAANIGVCTGRRWGVLQPSHFSHSDKADRVRPQFSRAQFSRRISRVWEAGRGA
jgi:hypothetical protein